MVLFFLLFLRELLCSELIMLRFVKVWDTTLIHTLIPTLVTTLYEGLTSFYVLILMDSI